MATSYIPIKSFDFSKSRLLIVCGSVGQSALIAGDLLTMNHEFSLSGYFNTSSISHTIFTDIRTIKIQPKPQISLSNEIYFNEKINLAVLILRSNIITVFFH